MQLVLGPRLGQVVVHARFGGNRGGGQRVVAGDHHRLDAHAAQLGKAFADAVFDDVLQLDHTKHARVVGHHQRRAAAARHLVNNLLHPGRKLPALHLHMLAHRVGRALAQCARAGGVLHVHTAHARLCGEGHEGGVQCAQFALAQTMLFLGQHHHAAAFRRFVGKRCHLRRIRQLRGRDTGRWQELAGLPIAQGDRAGLVEQQHVHVTRGLHGTA
ncbi:hypothetical protein SDC9_92740 [bioreactor metagenome]|uniref:Uncharacterized protein n=1 Tax=bioreactor metagenome TaxID=1076179 RepID=A0A644ZZG0_9ZZZZ